MAIDLASIRARIASGNIKPTAGGSNFGPKVGEGTFLCRIETASYGKGESGNNRGVLDLVVIDSENPAEIGGKIKRFSQTIRPEFAEQELALLLEVMKKVPGGAVRADRVFEDASSHAELIQNAFTQISKLVEELTMNKKALKVVLKRKQQAKLDERGRPRYYNDILLNETEALYDDAQESAPEAATQEAAPAATPAPEAAPAATGGKKKVWEQSK